MGNNTVKISTETYNQMRDTISAIRRNDSVNIFKDHRGSLRTKIYTRDEIVGSLDGYSGTICDVQQSVNGLIGVSIDNEIRYFSHNDLIVMKTYEDWESTSINIDQISSRIKLGKDEFGFKIHLRGLYKNYFSKFLGD